MPYIIFLLFWWVINCQTAAQSLYDKRGESKYGYTPVRKGQLWGVLDSTNRIVAACQYKNAQVVTFGCDITGLLLDGDYCFIGKDSLRCYQQLYGYENGYARASKNGLQGYVDKNGIEILPYEYKIEEIRIDETDYRIVTKNNGKKGIFTWKQPWVVIPAIYDAISFNDTTGRAIPYTFTVWKGNEVGVIDTAGHIIVPFGKQFAFFSNSKLIMCEDSSDQLSKVGITDLQRNVLIPVGTYAIKKWHWTQEYGSLVAQKDGKYGMLNKDLQITVPFQYDTLYRTPDESLLAKLDNKSGLIDFTGKILLPCEYDADCQFTNLNCCSPSEYNKFLVKKNNLYGVVNANYESILSCEYEEFVRWSCHRSIVKKNGYYRLLNYNMKELLPVVYDKIEVFSEVLLLKKGKKWSVLKDKKAIPLPKAEMYTKVRYLSSKLIVIERQEANGERINAIIDTTAKIVLPFSSKIATIELIDGHIIVSQKSENGQLLYGIIDYEGQIMLPIEYEQLRRINKSYLARKNGKLGIINLQNKWLVPAIYDTIEVLFAGNNTHYLGMINKKYYLINNVYQLITPTPYDNITQVEIPYFFRTHPIIPQLKDNEYFIVWRDDKKGLIDKQGKELISPNLIYDKIIPRTDGYYNIIQWKEQVDYWGLISPEGKLLVAPRSLSPIQIAGKMFVSTEVVSYPSSDDTTKKVNPQFDSRRPRLIDSSGNIIKEYDQVYATGSNETAVRMGGKIGIIDKNGKEIMPFVFDDIQMKIGKVGHTFHVVSQNGKWGILDSTMQWLVEPQYVDLNLIGYRDTKHELLQYSIENTINLDDTIPYTYKMWGVMDIEGKIITPPLYRYIGFFNKGHTKVSISNNPQKLNEYFLDGLIDSIGNTVLPPVHKMFIPYKNFLICEKQDGKRGLFDLQGKRIVPCRFNWVSILNETQVALTTQDSVYIIDYSVKEAKTLFALKVGNIGNCVYWNDNKLSFEKGDTTTLYYLDNKGYKGHHYSVKHCIRRVKKAYENNTVFKDEDIKVTKNKGIKTIDFYKFFSMVLDKKNRRVIRVTKEENIICNIKNKRVRTIVREKRL